MNRKLNFLLAFFFLALGILAFFFWGNGDQYWTWLDKKEMQTITVFENYELDIPAFMREPKSEEDAISDQINYENLIREVFITMEEYPYEEYIDTDSLDSQEIFAGVISKIREIHAQPMIVRKDTIRKVLSAATHFEKEGLQGSWFSMEMDAISNSPETFYVFSVYQDNNRYFLLTLATNNAFSHEYMDLFMEVVKSFRIKKK